ncbi:MAG TPA: hypothetical protein VIW29_13220 [Polyangiaceae bacterium]
MVQLLAAPVLDEPPGEELDDPLDDEAVVLLGVVAVLGVVGLVELASLFGLASVLLLSLEVDVSLELSEPFLLPPLLL